MNVLRLTLCLALLLMSLSCATARPVDRDADIQALLKLHEEGLRAHLEGDIDLLFEAEADDFVMANRGEVTTPSKEERKEFLGPYLQGTRFSTYRDVVAPIVKVSADGSLGWVIVQVEARGEYTGEDGTVQPVEFVSAWISLDEKRNGRWLSVGNVSNFKPDK
jgi:Domain of unknown function (DUF4440)